MAVSRSPAATPFEEAVGRREAGERPPLSPGEAEAAAAIDADWAAKQTLIKNSPVTAFLRAHEIAGTPNELTITGVADVKITLGDLRAFVRCLE